MVGVAPLCAAAAAGAFGLTGAAATPIAGRVADRRGPELVTRLGAALMLMPALPTQAQPGPLVLCALGFDLDADRAPDAGLWHRPGRAQPAERGDVHGAFIGMAAGSALGALALAQWGWMGRTVLATVEALAVQLWPSRRTVALAAG